MRKIVSAFLCVIIAASSIGGLFAFADNSISYGNVQATDSLNRSANTTFKINFTEHSIWTYDFSNSAFLFDHTGVTVEYLGAEPTTPMVEVKLFIQEEEGGDYVHINEGSIGYKEYIGINRQSAYFRLPECDTGNYRLIFTCNEPVTVEFRVKTNRQP